MKRSQHMPQLDGLRAIAVFLVILLHTTPVSHYTGAPGAIGVWLFYCLSGFLITGILLDARQDAEGSGESRPRVWRAFWVRRALRIFPLYYAVLAAVLLWPGAIRQEWGWYAGFFANWRFAWVGQWHNTLAHFWSLAVEEQFYLVWPLACLWLPQRILLRTAIVAIAVAPVSRLILAAAGFNEIAVTCSTLSCLDGLGLGAVLAITRWKPPWPVAAIGLVLGVGAVGAQLLGVLFLPRITLERSGYALFAWWLVARASSGFGGGVGRVLGSWPLLYIGRISYGIYILHAVIPAALNIAKSRFRVESGIHRGAGLSPFRIYNGRVDCPRFGLLVQLRATDQRIEAVLPLRPPEDFSTACAGFRAPLRGVNAASCRGHRFRSGGG